MEGDEDLRIQAMQVVAEHCKLRASDNDDDEEEEDNEVNKALIHRVIDNHVSFPEQTNAGMC